MNPQRMLKALLRGYDVAMQILRSGDKEVVKFVTPDGVTCVASTSIPLAALDVLEAQILRRRAERLRLASTDPASQLVRSPTGKLPPA